MGLPRLRFSDENIGRVMLVAFAAVGTVAVLGSVYAAVHIESGLHSHHHFHMPALQAIHAVDSRVKETVQEALAYLASDHPGEKAEFRSLVAQFEADAERFRTAARIDTPGEEEERERFESIVALARTVIERSERMFERFDHGGGVDAESFSEYEELVDRLNAELDDLVQAERHEVDLEHTQALAQLQEAKPLFVGIGVLTLVLALVFGRSVGAALRRHAAERRSAEEARRRLDLRMRETQKLESLGVLAGGIAHDFNNLLVGIAGNAELAVANVEADSVVREALEGIQVASARATDLTRELLAYAGKGSFRIEPLDLSQVVEGTLSLLRRNLPEAARGNGEFAAGELWVEGDATQIRQVVMNLITNAADALGGRDGAVTVRTGAMEAAPSDTAPARVLPVPSPGEYAFFEVEDTGCGMDPETLGRIFDPFFTTKAGGRGLGLAALLGIVQTHRGGVEVSSERGRGSVFRILLPRGRAPRASVETPSVRSARETGGGKVLVVDDQDLVARATARMLKAAGFDAFTAGGGREAIEILKASSEPLAAVILDLTMPDFSGERTFRALRALRSDLPVVFYSGHAEDEAESITAGESRTSFLEKPFTLESLTEKLREAGS
jgi:signal transduction histidine kinase